MRTSLFSQVGIRLLGGLLLLSLVLTPWNDLCVAGSAVMPEPKMRSSPPETDHRSADSWGARDKRMHLLVSAGMVGAGYHLLHDRWDVPAEDSRNISLSLTALAGLLKEFSDSRKVPSTCSYKDLVADGIGILIGVMIFTR